MGTSNQSNGSATKNIVENRAPDYVLAVGLRRSGAQSRVERITTCLYRNGIIMCLIILLQISPKSVGSVRLDRY